MPLSSSAQPQPSVGAGDGAGVDGVDGGVVPGRKNTLPKLMVGFSVPAFGAIVIVAGSAPARTILAAARSRAARARVGNIARLGRARGRKLEGFAWNADGWMDARFSGAVRLLLVVVVVAVGRGAVGQAARLQKRTHAMLLVAQAELGLLFTRAAVLCAAPAGPPVSTPPNPHLPSTQKDT